MESVRYFTGQAVTDQEPEGSYISVSSKKGTHFVTITVTHKNKDGAVSNFSQELPLIMKKDLHAIAEALKADGETLDEKLPNEEYRGKVVQAAILVWAVVKASNLKTAPYGHFSGFVGSKSLGKFWAKKPIEEGLLPVCERIEKALQSQSSVCSKPIDPAVCTLFSQLRTDYQDTLSHELVDDNKVKPETEDLVRDLKSDATMAMTSITAEYANSLNLLVAQVREAFQSAPEMEAKMLELKNLQVQVRSDLKKVSEEVDQVRKHAEDAANEAVQYIAAKSKEAEDATKRVFTEIEEKIEHISHAKEAYIMYEKLKTEVVGLFGRVHTASERVDVATKEVSKIHAEYEDRLKKAEAATMHVKAALGLRN